MTPRPAHTLPELLVTISVIGLLTGLLLSGVQQVRGAAARLACANNVRQVALASQNHESATGRLPAAIGPPVAPPPNDIGVPWTVTLLPYVEQEALYQQTLAAYRVTWETDLNPPHAGLAVVMKVYACPADGRLTAPITDESGITAAYKSYAAVGGGERLDGAMPSHRGGRRLAEVTDGASNTLLVGERPPLGKLLGGVWYTSVSVPHPTLAGIDANYGSTGLHARYPDGTLTCRGPIHYGPGRLSNDCDYFHFWSLHAGGAHFALCDGSVRFLRYDAVAVLPALATRAGGETVAVPD